MTPRIPNILRMYGERGIGLARGRWTSRLGVELGVALVLSLFLGVVTFFGMRQAVYYVLNQYLPSKDVIKQQEQRAVERLQEFILKKGMTASDHKRLSQWVSKEKYIELYIYRDENLLYSTYDIKGNTSRTLSTPAYTLTFSDGEAQVWVNSYYIYKYYHWIYTLCGFAGFFVFMVCFLGGIRKKTGYIELLKEELQILQGGNLAYQVTIKGSDELAELAQGINSMRCSIMEREEEQHRARCANHELVTAMSHDLRSPLTSLMGYLDFIDSGLYEDEKQWKHFVSNSRKKAFQIKEMSDRLFEYFLVYDDRHEELVTEVLDGAALLEQTIWEGGFDLESRGFIVSQEMGEITCSMMVNLELFRRLCANLFSNVIKYASMEEQVKISCREYHDCILIAITNGKDTTKKLVESSGIGLKTCKKIVEEHGGRFYVMDTDTEFQVEVFWVKSLESK